MQRFLKAHLATTVLVTLAALIVGYQVFTSFVAYTWNGYVAADIAELSPVVPGQILGIPVRNDQRVAEGQLLFEIDPAPYRIAVAKAEAALALAKANLAEAQEAVVVAQDYARGAQAKQTDAAGIRNRVAKLLESEFASQQSADNATRDLDTANAVLAASTAGLESARRHVTVQEAAIAVAEAELDHARYNLERTRVVAPTSGTVSPFTAKPGDYVELGNNVLAVISDNNWRVVANIEEQYVHGIVPGQTVYVRLASDPWTIHLGTVRNVARGIARAPRATGVLPFVPFDTDWIRLQRRFPMEIDLGDLPARRRLFAGADASVLLFMGDGNAP